MGGGRKDRVRLSSLSLYRSIFLDSVKILVGHLSFG